MSANPIISNCNSGGFTLVEMLMAMLVMTVGLLGLLQSVQMAYRSSLRDRVREEAVLLAEEQMHDWRRMSYERISTTVKSKSVDRTIGGGTRKFTVIRQGEETGALSGVKPVKKLRLAVTWSIQGDSCNHEIYTLKSQ